MTLQDARNRRMKRRRLIPVFPSGLILVAIIVGRMEPKAISAIASGFNADIAALHPPYDLAA